jgi:hypothetical protein
VAIVASNTISHGEELYVDYLQDERLDPEQLNYTPDWLLEPPPSSPFLAKKEYVARVPFLVKVLHAKQIAQLGRSHEEFVGRISKELPAHVQQKKKGLIAQKLEKVKA